MQSLRACVEMSTKNLPCDFLCAPLCSSVSSVFIHHSLPTTLLLASYKTKSPAEAGLFAKRGGLTVSCP